MSLKAGGKRQRLRVMNFSAVMREEGSKVGKYRKYFTMSIFRK
jgi:hypothetical protein